MKFSTNVLADALKFASSAISVKGEANPCLTGIKFISDGETCEIVAANGVALHSTKVELAEPSAPEEFVIEPFKVDPDKSGNGVTEITAGDVTAVVAQTADGKRKSEEVRTFTDRDKFVKHAHILSDHGNDAEYAVRFDPVLLAKSLKAFTKVGGDAAVELRFTANHGGGINPRSPVKIVNVQTVLGRVADETAIVLPLRKL